MIWFVATVIVWGLKAFFAVILLFWLAGTVFTFLEWCDEQLDKGRTHGWWKTLKNL